MNIILHYLVNIFDEEKNCKAFNLCTMAQQMVF